MIKNKPVSTRRSSFSLAAMLVGICLSFLGIIFISVIYIAKDYYAYNSVYAFFGIDSQTLLWLMGLPVGQKTLLRLLNFSHACFIVCSVMFAMSFSSLLPERVARFLGWLIGAIWLVQVVFLDPQFLSWLYMERIGVFDNVRFFRGLLPLAGAAAAVAFRRMDPVRRRAFGRRVFPHSRFPADGHGAGGAAFQLSGLPVYLSVQLAAGAGAVDVPGSGLYQL